MDTSTGGRPTRRLRAPRRWWTRSLLVGAALAALAAPAAWANHNFSDVLDANPHHADISAIFGARITTGCTPTTYCPGDAVQRQTMATFLRRGLGRTGASGTTAPINLTTTFQDIAQDTITAGGASGGTGFIVLWGSFTALAGNDLSIENRIEFRFIEDSTGSLSNVNSVTLEPSTNAFPSASPAKQWVFSIPTGVTRTYSLQARIAFPAAPTEVVQAESRLISLMYVPFGAAGTNTLGGAIGGSGAVNRSGEGQ